MKQEIAVLEKAPIVPFVASKGNAIVIRAIDHNFDIQILPELVEEKDKLVKQLEDVLVVTSNEEFESVSQLFKQAREMISNMEEFRVQSGSPLLKGTNLLNEKCKDFSLHLKDHNKRLSEMLGAFQKAEREKSDKIAQEEEKRRQDALREAAKRQQELDDQLAATKGVKNQMKVIEKMNDLETTTKETVLESHKAQIQAAPVKVAGIAYTPKWDYEVTDITQVLSHNPLLCKVTDDRTVITAMLKKGIRAIPGLRIFEVNKIR